MATAPESVLAVPGFLIAAAFIAADAGAVEEPGEEENAVVFPESLAAVALGVIPAGAPLIGFSVEMIFRMDGSGGSGTESCLATTAALLICAAG